MDAGSEVRYSEQNLGNRQYNIIYNPIKIRIYAMWTQLQCQLVYPMPILSPVVLVPILSSEGLLQLHGNAIFSYKCHLNAQKL